MHRIRSLEEYGVWAESNPREMCCFYLDDFQGEKKILEKLMGENMKMRIPGMNCLLVTGNMKYQERVMNDLREEYDMSKLKVCFVNIKKQEMYLYFGNPIICVWAYEILSQVIDLTFNYKHVLLVEYVSPKEMFDRILVDNFIVGIALKMSDMGLCPNCRWNDDFYGDCGGSEELSKMIVQCFYGRCKKCGCKPRKDKYVIQYYKKVVIVWDPLI